MIDSPNIVEFVKKSGSPYWKIMTHSQKASAASPRICESQNEEAGADLEASMEYLQQCIDMLGNGRYLIRYWDSPKSKTAGFYETPFMVGEPVKPQIGNANNTQYGIGNIGAIISEKVEAEMNKIKIAKLEEELAEARENLEDPAGWKTQIAGVVGSINETAPQLWPHIGMALTQLIQGIGSKFGLMAVPGLGTAPEVMQPPYQAPQTHDLFNQPNNMNNSTLTPEQVTAIETELDTNSEAYSQILFKLRAIDPDLLNTLTKLVAKLEASPGMLPMLKTML